MSELDVIEPDSALEYDCALCKDWSTIVETNGDWEVITPEFPCPRCRRDEWRVWRAVQLSTPGQLVLVGPSRIRHRVVLPSHVGLEGEESIQPCQPEPGKSCHEVVLVRPDAGGEASWVSVDDVLVGIEPAAGY